MFKYELPNGILAHGLITQLRERGVDHKRIGQAVFADYKFDQALMLEFIEWEQFLVPMGDWDTLNVIV